MPTLIEKAAEVEPFVPFRATVAMVLVLAEVEMGIHNVLVLERCPIDDSRGQASVTANTSREEASLHLHGAPIEHGVYPHNAMVTDV